MTYKDTELVKITEADVMKATPNTTGPAFRNVYKLMGPSYAGEYMPPRSDANSNEGLYVLSYPGVAFTFPLQNSAYSPDLDFVALLSSTAASPSTCMAIFDGTSWPEARQDFMVKSCSFPRSLALSCRGREFRPDEIELATIQSDRKVNLERRVSPPFQIVLNRTRPQDLVAELGPPDAIYRKYDRRLSIHKTHPKDKDRSRRFSSNSRDHGDQFDNDQSSAHTTTDDSDNDDQSDIGGDTIEDASAECFYNYFHHGFDVFISYPAAPSSTLFPIEANDTWLTDGRKSNELVATKMLFHGNIPGSFPFNRYRRSRWIIETQNLGVDDELNSETGFGRISEALLEVWQNRCPEAAGKDQNKNPMVLNRDWNNSPGSSCEMLGEWEDSADISQKNSTIDETGTGPGFGNTKLYGFPGLLFEVLKNDAVSCLTVY